MSKKLEIKKIHSNLFTVPISIEEIQDIYKSTTTFITINTNRNLSKKELIRKAIDLHSRGKVSEAKKSYENCIRKNFEDPVLFSNYGLILKDEDKIVEAEKLFRKAIHLKPDYAEAYNNLGDVLRMNGQLNEAEIMIRKSLQLKENYADAHANLGTIFKILGRLDEALLSFDKASELAPDSVEIYSIKAEILINLGKLKEAEKSYRTAIKIKPNPALYSNLAGLLVELGLLDEAYNNCCKAISLKPDFSEALMNRWSLLMGNREYDLALKDADSCNTKQSRAAGLEALYALGRIDEIYDRIDKTSEIDNENIRIAAFSAFLNATEKREMPNKFCQDPLSFIYFSNLKYHLDNNKEFIGDLINELYQVESTFQPIANTTRNGFQTPSGINLLSKSTNCISIIKSIILKEIDEYYLKFKHETCTFIEKWPSNNNIFGWHVILKKQGYQSAHIHPGGWLSGVIYLKVVPALDNDEGSIEFSLNGVHYHQDNSPKRNYQPQSGDVVMFPSSLYHRTIPFTTNTDRIVVAFDLMPQ